MNFHPVVMVGLVVVFGAIAMPLLSSKAKEVGGSSQVVSKSGIHKVPTSIPYNPMIRTTGVVQEPVLVQEPTKEPQKAEVEVPSPQRSRGFSASKPKPESEQDILKSLPRQKLPNGKCPNEQFRRTVPEGGGRIGGLPLSDCEPYPEDTHQG